MSGPDSEPQPPPTAGVRRPTPWWRTARGQAVLAAAVIVMAAFSAIMLGSVHGLQNRVIRLQRAATPPLAVWLAPDLPNGVSNVPRIDEADVATGLRATLALPRAHLATPPHLAVVRTADGRRIWTSDPVSVGDERMTVTTPPGLLKRGVYQIVVLTAAGGDLALYSIHVTGR